MVFLGDVTQMVFIASVVFVVPQVWIHVLGAWDRMTLAPSLDLVLLLPSQQHRMHGTPSVAGGTTTAGAALLMAFIESAASVDMVITLLAQRKMPSPRICVGSTQLAKLEAPVTEPFASLQQVRC